MSLLDRKFMEPNDAGKLNSLQLAYIGDVVWEALVRTDLVLKKLNVHHMHDQCIRFVNAHAQAEWLALLRSTLTEEETEIVRRGKNAHAHHSAPKNQQPADYAAATAFEALLGYLYLTGNEERIRQISDIIMKHQV